MDRQVHLDIEAARRAMTLLREQDLRSVSIDRLRELVNPVVRGHRANALRIPNGRMVFRARATAKPNHIKELTYPPAHLCQMGRVNREGMPVLYCATTRAATFFELGAGIDDTVVVAAWRLTAPLMVNHVGFTRGALEVLGSERSQDSLAELATGNSDDEEIRCFLAERFAEPVDPAQKYRYKLTVAIAETLLAGELFDGLVYPTVRMRGNADNLAITPRFADSCLEFERAEFCRLEAVRKSRIGFRVLDTAARCDHDGAVGWTGRSGQWARRDPSDEQALSPDDSRWFAQDELDQVIELE